MLWVALFYGMIAVIIFILFPKIFAGMGSFFARKVENLTTVKEEPQNSHDYRNYSGTESAAAGTTLDNEEEETCRKTLEKSQPNSGEN